MVQSPHIAVCQRWCRYRTGSAVTTHGCLLTECVVQSPPGAVCPPNGWCVTPQGTAQMVLTPNGTVRPLNGWCSHRTWLFTHHSGEQPSAVAAHGEQTAMYGDHTTSSVTTPPVRWTNSHQFGERTVPLGVSTTHSVGKARCSDRTTRPVDKQSHAPPVRCLHYPFGGRISWCGDRTTLLVGEHPVWWLHHPLGGRIASCSDRTTVRWTNSFMLWPHHLFSGHTAMCGVHTTHSVGKQTCAVTTLPVRWATVLFSVRTTSLVSTLSCF